MPQLGTKIGMRDSRGGSVFHLAEEDYSRPEKRKMSLRRLVLSAFSICLGLLGFYAVLHYVPAYLYPNNILKDSADTQLQDYRDRRSGLVNTIAPYWDALRLRSSYVWEGERIEVSYALQPGEIVELSVTRCARTWLIEIVNCQPVEQSRVTVDHTTHRKVIRVSGPGFYEFRETSLTGGTTPRIIWRRSRARG